jgi:beta-phosphoglucomutase-like phosphatase (HAD superfamily)
MNPWQSGPVTALIFDLDGTMIDSMPSHARSWGVFAQRHGLNIDLADLMRRTTGRTGVECMRELFQRDLAPSQALELIAEKERIYRELFAPAFTEVAGFSEFFQQARSLNLKIGIGTAGDHKNIAFALSRLKLPEAPLAVVGGDEGFPGKPEPVIFLQAARRMNESAANSIVFEDSPLGVEAARRAGMRAVALCTTHDAAQLAGDHVVANARNYFELMDLKFLENLHVAIS